MTRFIRGLALYVLVSMSVAGLALAQTPGGHKALEAEEALEVEEALEAEEPRLGYGPRHHCFLSHQRFFGL